MAQSSSTVVEHLSLHPKAMGLNQATTISRRRENYRKKVLLKMTSGRSTVVDHLSHYTKVTSSSQDTNTDTRRDYSQKKTIIENDQWQQHSRLPVSLYQGQVFELKRREKQRTVIIEITNGHHHPKVKAGNTKGGSITVPLTSCLTSLESAV